MEKIYSTAEYEEMERLIPGHIQQVRSILEEEHDIVIPAGCEEFVARCLRLKDGNLEKAVKLVLTFHSVIPEFQGWDATFRPSLRQEFFKIGTAVPLIKRDSEGRLIFFVRIELWDPAQTNFDQVIASFWMMIQYVTAQLVDTQKYGYITVWDYRNFSLHQAWAVKQWRLLSLAKWAQNGVAGRLKAFHVINHPRAATLIYKAIKPFLKEKLKKRLNFHDSTESLLKMVDGNCLPNLVGGTLDPYDCIDRVFLDGFFNSDQYFQDMMETGVPRK